MRTAETELLVDYVASGSQRAFSGIVSRHVDLVFSAAQRQVRCAQLAEEVTQNVFVALARNAHRLKPDPPLVAWLYLVTRRACIDALRAEARRKVREKTAMEMSHNKLGRGNLIYGDGASGVHRAILRAYAEFVRTRQGERPNDAMQLQAYLRQPVEPRQLQDFWSQHAHMLK
jgi:RNA polymerase sigma factor (sigma-70 family)